MAAHVTILHGQERTDLTHEHGGVWVGELPVTEVPDYRVEVTYDGFEPVTHDDPYRHLPTLGELDIHLISEGRHEQLWKVLGAHVRSFDDGVTGTGLAGWAPNARGVRVIEIGRAAGRERVGPVV